MSVVNDKRKLPIVGQILLDLDDDSQANFHQRLWEAMGHLMDYVQKVIQNLCKVQYDNISW